MHATRTIRISALFAALVILAAAVGPQHARAQSGTGSAGTGSSSTRPSGIAAPRWAPLLTPEDIKEIERQYAPGGEKNPLWNPQIQENVYRQLKADGVLDTSRTPWWVPARKIAMAIFALGMLVTALRNRRAAKKQEIENQAAAALGKVAKR